MVKIYNGDNFSDIIKKRILVDFYADWCGPCKMLGPVLEKVNGIDVLKVNVDDNQDLARKYGVMSIPCLILFDEGEEVKRSVGFMNDTKIQEFIQK